MISIHLRNGVAFWTRQQIYQINLKTLGIDKQEESEEAIIGNIKKLLVESVRELTRCLRGLYEPNQ
jgi:uncharacterized protein YdiU (UPF0061 family)